MLRKRSRTVGGKQGLLSDTNGFVTQTDHKFTKPATSSFFNSPRLFTCFSPKGFSDSESMMSPTSILDSKTFSGFGNPFLNDHSSRSPDSVVEQRHPWEEMGSIGLGIVDALSHEKQLSKPERRMVLFGSHLKITIPPLQPSAIFQTPKTSDSQFGPSSPCSVKKTPLDSVSFSPVFTGCLSASEMELSEDYTCVISHGPNPRTTHIFGNCVIESCCGVGFSANGKESSFLADRQVYPSDDFLSFCYTCKKSLVEGKDIYMYRGEKAFCSSECRYQEMLFDEGMEKCGFFGTEHHHEQKQSG